jgi:elongation factor G
MKALRHEAPRPEALRARLPSRRGSASRRRRDLRRPVPQAPRQDAAAARVRAAARRPAARRQAAGAPQPRRSARQHPPRPVEEGEIVMAAKADHLTPGGSRPQAALHPTPDWNRPLPPLQHRILQPVHDRDSVKLSGALATMAEGDSRAHRRPGSRDRLPARRRPGAAAPAAAAPAAEGGLRLEVEEVMPAPDYRETIAKPHDQAYRHKKQTGGAGQFADVKLTVAPAAARRGLRLRRGGEGRRGAAQLHPRGRGGRARRDGARPARLSGRRRRR